MSSIVLSAAVRQNLLALQNTAQMMSTTQTALSTGNKVNSALDNPTNFFTAQGLNNRAADISNLLDGISNGVQVLQAANTGITTIQSYLDQAKSIANQALQAPVGYSTKSSVTSTAITSNGVPATANNLLGVGTQTAGKLAGSALTAGTTAAASATGTAVTSITAGTSTPATLTAATALGLGNGSASTAGTISGTDLTTQSTPYSMTTKLSDLGYKAGDQIMINRAVITLGAGAGGGIATSNTTSATLNSAATIGDLAGALAGTGGTAGSLIDGGHQSALTISNGTIGIAIGGSNSNTASTDTTNVAGLSITPTTGGNATGTSSSYIGVGQASGTSLLSTLTNNITSGDTLTVNGKVISFTSSGANSLSSTGASLNATTATLGDLASAIDTIAGTGTATIGSNGQLVITSGASADVTLTGSAVNKLGLSTTIGATASVTAAPKVTAAGSGTVDDTTLLSNLTTPLISGDTLTVNGKSLTFGAGATSVTAQGGTLSSTAKLSDLFSAIQTLTGGATPTISNGKITVSSASGTAAVLGGNALAKLGLSTNTGANASVTLTPTSTPATASPIVSNTLISSLAQPITSSDTLTVNGKTIDFANTGTNTATSLNASTSTVQNVLDAIDAVTGGTAAIDNTGKITLTSSSGQAESLSGSVLSKLGLSTTSNLNIVPTQAAGSYAPGIQAGTAVQFPASYNAGTLTGTALTGGVTSQTLLSALSPSGLGAGDNLTVNGTTIQFGQSGLNTATSLNSNATVGDLLSAINANSGGGSATISPTGVISISTGNTGPSGITVVGTALSKLGLTTSTSATASLSVSPVAQPATAIAGNTLVSKLPTPITAGSSFTVNGKTISFAASGPYSATSAGATLNASTATVSDVLSAITTISGGSATIDTTGRITIGSTSSSDTVMGATLDVHGAPVASSTAALASLGLSSVTDVKPLSGTASSASASTLLSDLGAGGITSSDTLTVNGKTITFGGAGGNSSSSTGASLGSAATVSDLLSAIDKISGGHSTIDTSTGAINVTAADGSTLALTGTALSKLGLDPTSSGSVTAAPVANTLSFGAIGNGTATTVTFGTGAGQVSTLAQLNSQLAADNLQATLDTSGRLTISTTNDDAAETISITGGTAFSATNGAFSGATPAGPVADATATATRTNLVSQYNAILAQINNTAADSSYNGVNLLNGDQLQLTFNETGKSQLSITGIQANAAGLGLATLSSSAFNENSATNAVLNQLTKVSTDLRSQASAFGSNLSVVQTRQDFNKNLINVLQTGSSNLTQADINQEAADSQALSTRQSLSVSALSLANQAQQSVLQLLR